MQHNLPSQQRFKIRPSSAQQEKLIGKLVAENIDLREQIADIVLKTATMREELENWLKRN